MADIKVYGHLVNWTSDYPSYVVSSDQIYDTKKQKTQEEINAEEIGYDGGLFNVNNKCGPRRGGENYDLESAVEAVYRYPTLKPVQRNGITITFWNGLRWENWRYSLFYDVEDPQAELKFLNIKNWEIFDTTVHPNPIRVLSEEEYYALIDIEPDVLYCLYETEKPESDEMIDTDTNTAIITSIDSTTATSSGTIQNGTLFMYEVE